MIKAAADKNPPVFGFDCVCLIKGILWGWNGDASAAYGGAKYKANGVPDINADMMITKCSGVTTDFAKIKVGEVLWRKGHIGVYIGNGLGVECTPKWDNGVQITAVANIGKKSGYNARTWTKHGKLPYVTYTEQSTPVSAGYKVGDKVRIIGDKYTNGVGIPASVRGKVYTVQQLKKDRTLLKEIVSWVYTRDVEPAGIRVGSRVRITGAQYTNGIKIPGSVKKGTYTVQQIKDDHALLKEIYSWVYLKDLQA